MWRSTRTLISWYDSLIQLIDYQGELIAWLDQFENSMAERKRAKGIAKREVPVMTSGKKVSCLDYRGAYDGLNSEMSCV